MKKNSSLPIRSTPKLTEKHIHPNNFQKMKVKLATQVLSHTVAASLCMHVSVGALPSTAMGTAEFIQKFDSVFDCVNSSTLHSTKKFKCALTDQTTHQKFMKEAISFIKELKVFNGAAEVTGRIKCLKGWLITLNAIILIWEHLKTNHDFKFLLTSFLVLLGNYSLVLFSHLQPETVMQILTISLPALGRLPKQSHSSPHPLNLKPWKLDQQTTQKVILIPTLPRRMHLHMLQVIFYIRAWKSTLVQHAQMLFNAKIWMITGSCSATSKHLIKSRTPLEAFMHQQVAFLIMSFNLKIPSLNTFPFTTRACLLELAYWSCWRKYQFHSNAVTNSH